MGQGWGKEEDGEGYADPTGTPSWDAGMLPAVCTLQPSSHEGSRDPTLPSKGLHQGSIWPWFSQLGEEEQSH